MSEAAVLATELTKRYAIVTAVDRLSMKIDRGELFGLVGPDGAGKTTTLRMLAGILRPTSGDASVLSVSVARDPERVKHRIAYMPQRFGLYNDLTVRENIEFFADLYRVPRDVRGERVERLHQFSNLGPFQDRLAGRLSGGMKQKLALSCALVHQPDVLLLDEPTFGVDPISRRDLWLLVHEMVARGTTAIVSTAYMDEAERFDRLLLLHKGRRISEGTPDELKRQVRGELLSVRVDRPQLAREAAIRLPSVRGAALFGEFVHLSVVEGTDPAGVGSELSREGVRVHGIERIPRSLEDVFIERISEEEGA